MPKIEYKSIKFQQKSLELIRLVNQVVVLIILIWDWVRPLWVLKKCIC